jgi:Pyruvate/2-oxoacid:ferredoxin oxidoreductase delta subunit
VLFTYFAAEGCWMTNGTGGRRVIEVQRELPNPGGPRNLAARPKGLRDFPGVAEVHLQVAKRLSSPLLMGPPLSDELIALVQHLFTEEEAGVVRHLGQLVGRTVDDLARAERRAREQIEPLVHQLAVVKRAIASDGAAGQEKYRLLPIMPGIFEMVLIGSSPETISPWHRRFAELFESLYETGYARDYQRGRTRPAPFVRVLPIGRTIDAHPMALPSDRLEVILDRYDTFGVGQCQCRLTTAVAGRGCGRPLGNCTVMGQWAERGIAHGWLKPVTRTELLDIKREAETQGLVTWMMNIESLPGQISCSCCGCCCHAMRLVTEFNVPGIMAPAHFRPHFNAAQCTACGKCVRGCPTQALTLAGEPQALQHQPARCIGCGLCAVACNLRRAVLMEPVPDYQLPYRSWFSLLFHSGAGMVQGAWQAWRGR